MTIGSTFNPGLSSVYNLSIVPEEPPAPAARVEVGLAFLTDSLWSAAARRRIADRGPPGGEPARAIEEDPLAFCADGVESGPDSGPEVMGEDGLGEACEHFCQRGFFCDAPLRAAASNSAANIEQRCLP